MSNKTKKGMMSRFFEDDIPVMPSPTPVIETRTSKPISGMDVLNKAMDVLSTSAGQQEIDINSIGFSLKNKRALSPAEFQRLKTSIQTDGLFNPITVRKSDDPTYPYMAVAGHNRLQAMKELGYKTVPVNIVDLKDDGAKAAFISNLLQPELGIAEIFDGLRILKSGDLEQKSVRQLAIETGFSPAYISQVLSMEQLPVEVVVAMKRCRVRVGSNALKSFVKFFAEHSESDIESLASKAGHMLEQTYSDISSSSPTRIGAESQLKDSGEDAVAVTWQKAFKKFIAENSGSKLYGSEAVLKRKIDLKGWTFTEVHQTKNQVVLNFETEEDAATFLNLYKKSRKN